MFAGQADGTFRFTDDVTGERVELTGDPELAELWRRARRFGGRGVLNAVDNVRDVLGPAFVGKGARELGSLAEIDRALLQIELQTARDRGKDVGDPVATVQLKANMGMNAILAMSLALARFKAFSEGKELWQLLREQLTGALEELAHGARRDGTAPSYDRLVADLSSADLRQGDSGRPLYEAVRDQLAIYEFDPVPALHPGPVGASRTG
jgi:hypothetical protein